MTYPGRAGRTGPLARRQPTHPDREVDVVRITRLIGTVLIVVGVVAYVATSGASWSAFIPSIVGALLLVAGIIAGNERARPHAMHAALLVSLVGLLSSFMPLRSLPDLLGGGEVERPGAVISAAIMAVLLAIHLVAGIRSFAAARRTRNAA